MPQTNNRAFLITGVSSGIGEACVLHFDRPGWRIFGTVRSDDDAKRLDDQTSDRVTILHLDVTDSETIAAGAALLSEHLAGVGLAGLVNNAGISIGGPLELVTLDQARRQFEVNVWGQLAMIQAVLPLLKQAQGRIVNIGSIAGRTVFPYSSLYSMSKWSLEAMTEALRIELRPWHIHASIIEPGSINTKIWKKGAKHNQSVIGSLDEAYQAYSKPLSASVKTAQRVGKWGIPPVRVARVVEHALTSRWPRSRYLVGIDAHLVLLGELLPDWLRDRMIWMGINRITGK